MKGKMMTKYVRLQMHDGSEWDISASVIADDYAKFTAKQRILEGNKTSYDELYHQLYYEMMENGGPGLVRWLKRYMPWSIVSRTAQQVGAMSIFNYAHEYKSAVSNLVNHD